MEELGFHRKYRPKTLSEYIGNEKLKIQIFSALESNKKPQAILLKGPAGTGKTSMARLLAKEYLCENRDIKGGACNTCYNCKAINEFIETGRSDVLTNIKEVDATDSNKKKDIDDMLDDIMLPSFDGNWKIFILDECHELTSGAQNRLLKTLEEPPEKVLIILCTTNPEKLLDTIKSRCQYKFQVQKPTKEELSGLLKTVCQKEHILWESRALSVICAKSDFVPRQALILIDNVINTAKEVTYEKTVKVLDIVTETYYFEFFDILLEQYINIQKYISFLGKVKIKMQLSTFMEGIIPFIMRGLYVSNGVTVEALDISEIEQYKKVFKKFNIEDISYLLGSLVNIKESRDMEAKLMLLGFTGVHKPKQVSTIGIPNVTTSEVIVDNTKLSASDEKKAGEDAYLKSVTVTEEIKLKTIEDFSKPIDLESIASDFGGILIQETK